MFNLFETKRLCQIGDSDAESSVKLATFSRIKPEDDESEDLSINRFNLALYCTDYRLLLIQLQKDNDQQEPRWRHFTIPFDQQKGPITSMSMSQQGDRLLAVTSQSVIYEIPFAFRSFYDSVIQKERTVIEEDARVIRCCSLKNPTAIVWWQRDPRYFIERRSVAIVGDDSGRLAMIDLEREYEFGRTSIPFAIKSLAIYEEMYNRSLLITCHQGFQYQMVLEEFRTRFNHSPTSSSSPKNDSNFNSSLLNNFNNYYLSCLLNLPMENDQEVLGKTSREDPIQETTEALRPQLITFNNEIDIQSFLTAPDTDPRSPDIQNAATVASEFFFFTDHDLTSGAHKSSTAKIAIHPQASPVYGSCSNIFVVKHRNAKIQLSEAISTTPPRSITPSGGSSNDADESMNSDDSSDFFMVSNSDARSCSVSKKSSSKSSEFCNISLSRNDQLWEVYEYSTQKFCTKTILLSSAKLFAINLDPAPETEMVRLIDCSYRFMLLAFQDRCFLVSKTFAEQTKHTGPSSPRSPLLLRRTDSGHRRGLGGSFRKKTSPSSGQNPPIMSVIDEFLFEPIVDVFLLSPGSNRLGIREYLQQRMGQSMTSLEMLADLDAQTRHERRLVQVLASDDIQDETVVVDEQFLVVTKNGVYVIQSREKSFGRYFHEEVESLVTGSEGMPTTDGDLISKAKLMVDCFATVSRITNTKQYQVSPQHIPSQSWQLWLCRSALLLMRSMAEKLETWPDQDRVRLLSLGQLSLADLNLINWLETRIRHSYRLLELSRSSRKRVVVSLNYFRYWYRTIDQVKKFFQTRVVFEINEEERAFLADQLLDALIEVRRFYDQIQDQKNLLEAEQNLYRFLFEFRTNYDSERTLQKLIDEQLLEMAEYLALMTGNYAHLCHFILRRYPPSSKLPKSLRENILELLTSDRVTYALIISTDYVGPQSISLIESYLQFMFHHLPRLSRRFLSRLAWVFDPQRLPVRLMLNQTLEYCHQTYLCHQYEEIHDKSNTSLETSLITPNGRLRPTLLPIKRRDLLNLHLFVQLLYQRKVLRKKSMYDWTFTETTAGLIENYLKARKPAKVISHQDSNFSDWHVTAGTYCSVAYNQDHFYLWGKFDYANVFQDYLKGSQPSPGVESAHKLKTPTLNRFFSSVVNAPIRSIVVGHQHLMILTTVGLFGLGSSNFGQLGLGSTVLMSRYPALLDFPHELFKVVCGSYHTMAITDDGQLYCWGWALHGQLGHGITEDEFKPKLVQFFVENNLKVKDCAAGYAHSAVLTTEGDLYVFGENSYGQIGVAEPGIISTADQTSGKSKFSLPQKFCLLGDPVRLVMCGLFHTAAVTSNDESEKLFCWGIDPKTWRLKMRSDRSQAARKRSPSPMADISSDQCNTVFDYAKIREISLARLPDGARILKLSAGQSHSLLLTDQNGIYAFGYGREGQLGCSMVRSPSINSSNSNRQCSDEAMPVLEDRQFLDVACGALHSLALDSFGNIWGWGQTSNYQLSSTTDDLPTSGANRNEDDDSPIRPNRTSNLLNPASTSIMNQMILVSPKNCRWTPSIIMSLDQARNKLQHSFESRQRTLEEFPQVLPVSDIEEKLRQKIVAFLIFALDDLELSSLIRRFNQLDFHQLGAIACWIYQDQIGWLKYQLEALKQEICSTNSDKLAPEISKLLRFILERKSSKFSGSQTVEILEIFLSFWQQFDDNRPEFVGILKEVFLVENSAQDPFFGLHLLKLLREQEELREKLALTDQILLDLVKRIEDLLMQHPESIPAVQTFFSEFLDLKQVFKCPNKEADQGPPAFPYSIKYQSVMAQFGEDHVGGDLDESNNNHEPNDELEIRIPSDIEDEETPALLVFRCGHYSGIREFRHKLKRLAVDEDPRTERFRDVYEKLLSNNDLPESELANDLKEMDCIDCS